MHHIDLGLFKYQLEFTQEILKKVGGLELQKIFDERLRQIPRFPGLNHSIEGGTLGFSCKKSSYEKQIRETEELCFVEEFEVFQIKLNLPISS
ncbi:uncharacterized protein OCT59_009800 [Rhizophagus irregularis]|uniref:uncharacterized protein n=1 Tax=Rhizophagus irregularis TaxID=588596 RepID=UPI0033274A91|nr:hypothetical protein OCT59_009800 [Rhizophagus irregularis]